MYDCKIRAFDTTERCVADCDCKEIEQEVVEYKNTIDGYVGVITRWREKSARWGYPPPATPSMVMHGAAFSLEAKAKQAKVPQEKWDAHVRYMQAKFTEKELAVFYLDYIPDYETWEKVR